MRNEFNNNSAEKAGAVFCESLMRTVFSNNVLCENAAETAGAMIVDWGLDFKFVNNVVSYNIADSLSGLCLRSFTNAELINNIIWGNQSGAQGALYAANDCSLSVSYCDIQDSVWPGTGNICIEPLFRNIPDGDYHLMSIACLDSTDSPCIDMGDPSINDFVLDCGWGLGAPVSDMGAYGGGDSISVSIDDPPNNLPEQLLSSSVYPNPFNSSVTISFTLSNPGNVNLYIYDILGRKIANPINEYLPSGKYNYVFTATRLASGVYLYRVSSGQYVSTGRMTLLR
jgi:hypothetical protein